MWWFFRFIASSISHFLIVVTIPLAFDIGGRECGLAFSLSLAVFYFFQSILHLVTPDESRFRKLAHSFIGTTSWFTVLALLIWSLNKFSVDAPSSGWVERTFGSKRAADTSIREWIFGRGGLLEGATIGGWDKLLRWSIPVFQIGEGFCSLLVIQAVGQVSRWLVNQEHGDSWMVNHPISDSFGETLTVVDRSFERIRRYHLQHNLFSLEDYHFPGNWQCRRNSHRRRHHLRHISCELGNCQWKRKSC